MKVLRVWHPTCGGTISLTATHLIDDFRGSRAHWTHADFVEKMADSESLSSKMIVSLYGEKIIQEILLKIGC